MPIAPLFASGLKRLDSLYLSSNQGGKQAKGGPAAEVWRQSMQNFAQTFLSSRVSTEMQMTHYMACLQEERGKEDSKVGMLDLQCDPLAVCQQAIAEVQDGVYACAIEADNPCGDIRFCQAPRYLYYIMLELLKNAAKATNEMVAPAALDEHPVTLSVCANEVQVVIRVSDRGGGMPFQAADEMWSFVSTARRTEDHGHHKCSSVEDEEEEDLLAAQEAMDGGQQPLGQSLWGVSAGSSPLQARGIGLPLSRLYAKFLGGSLELINLPGLGVDAYLFLNRLDPYEKKGEEE